MLNKYITALGGGWKLFQTTSFYYEEPEMQAFVPKFT